MWLFSMYYNIKILLQPFDKQKIINSGLKIAVFIIGLTLLCVWQSLRCPCLPA